MPDPRARVKRVPRPPIEDGDYVITFEEKHGARIFVCRSMQDLGAICLTVLRDRIKDEYWYYNPTEDAAPEAPDYTDPAEIAALRGALKERAETALLDYKRAIARREGEIEDYNEIIRAGTDGDGMAAYRILGQRSGHEYERMDIDLAEEFSKDVSCT